MADQSLQAFQLGASLYDRAQTQKRMIDQVNMQLADQQMRKEHYDIQNQVASNQLATGLAEQKKFSFDLPKIQAWQSAYVQWNAKGDPTAAFPAPPTDLQSATGLKMLGDMSGPVIQSLPMAQNRFLLEKANASQMAVLNKEIDFLNENGKSDIPLQYNGGLDPKTQQINPEFRAAIFAAAAPLRQEQAKLKNLTAIGLAGQRNTKEGLKDLLDSGGITQQLYEQLLPTARTEGGVVAQRAEKVIKEFKNQGLIKNDSDESEATAYLMGAEQGKTPAPVIKSLNAANSAVIELDNAFKKLEDFEKKYGKGSFNEYVGPLDSPIFDLKGRFKTLTPQEQQDAKAVHTKIQMVISDYRNQKFGQTLTDPEITSLEKVVSSPSRNDYTQVISTFRDNLRSGAENTIWDYRFSPSIPAGIKNRYLPGARQKFEFQQAAPAAPAAGGLSIDSNALDAELKKRNLLK
jgi:hypothetical protein